MVAVGLPGVFKYGAKFLGYLVAVVVVAGVFVVAGVAVAATGGLNLAAPSLASLATGSAIAGALLALLGVVVGLSGLFGLVHKLLADAAAVAVASTTGTTVTDTSIEGEGDVDADEAAADDESPDADQPAAAPEADETPLDGEDTTGTVTGEPATDRPVDDAAHRDPPEPPTSEPAPSAGQPDGGPPSGAEGPDQQAMDGAGPSPSRTDVESHPYADDFVDESSAADDWTDSKYATGTQAGDVEEPAASTDSGSPGDDTGDAVSETADQDRAEWTPPDPAEFEQSSEPAEDPAPDRRAETATDEPVGAVDADSSSDDAVRTWDDVQSASDGNGIETERETTDVGQTEPAASESTDAVDLPDDDGSDDLFAQDEPNFTDPEPDETGDDDGATPEDDEDDEDDDLTLADEGVSSFEVDGDDDPLGDRLS
ncbi:hypothetical protein OB920_04580 [Halobacteria archaeon HArc-gm2]|nr:hypothetical protein [Halobacteria archaeon HArc-gm2]